MSNGDDGRSATDIITYIGVPLAVLGVLPILYNTFATLASLSRIKRMLRHSRLTALTRSDVVNRVIEIELPRYAVMPFDRFEDRQEYWTLSRTPSLIPGGSWSKFNWRVRSIGMKTQRVEYADQVRQPQAEVAFDELVCYLLDLGAVPDPQGWKLLRSAGMWAPVGCALMKSPSGNEKALTIAPLHDSDGHISLTVAWSSSWITRDHAHLPPYWVTLPCPPPLSKVQEEFGSERGEDSKADASSKEMGQTKGHEKAILHKAEPDEEAEAEAESQRGTISANGDIERQVKTNESSDLTCQISINGLSSALVTDAIHPTNVPQSLYINHLRVTGHTSNGVWFASAATAYGTSSQTILWNYKIPDAILSFSRQSSVPCGVLVLLDMVDEKDTPEWETKYDDQAEKSMQFMRRAEERHHALMTESRMTPEQKNIAVRERMSRESRQMLHDMQDERKIKTQREELRTREALQSPTWDNNRVAEYALKWLHQEKAWDSHIPAKNVVGFVLHRMVLDGEFAASICQMLDVWKSWADMGGMKKADLNSISENPAIFAQATLLISLIRNTGDELEGTLAMDLQECLRLWRTVRLG